RDSQPARPQSVDPARAAVAEEALLWPGQRPEAVGRADWHARADEDLAGVGKACAEGPGDVSLVEWRRDQRRRDGRGGSLARAEPLVPPGRRLARQRRAVARPA